MSNLIFNMRFIYWHLQIRRGWPWVAVVRNDFLYARGECRPFVQLY